MGSRRLLGIAGLTGLLVIAAATVLFATGHPRWAATAGAAGLLLTQAHQVWASRRAHHERSTLRSNLARARRQQLVAEASRPVENEAEIEHPQRTAAEDSLTQVAVLAWHAVEEQRQEGPCCLIVGEADARAITGAASLPINVHRASAAALPVGTAHAMGCVVLDLDLLGSSSGASQDWTRFAGWLRDGVPVVGYSREPAGLGQRAAAVSRATDLMLLPCQLAPGLVRFDRGLASTAALESPAHTLHPVSKQRGRA